MIKIHYVRLLKLCLLTTKFLICSLKKKKEKDYSFYENIINYIHLDPECCEECILNFLLIIILTCQDKKKKNKK